MLAATGSTLANADQTPSSRKAGEVTARHLSNPLYCPSIDLFTFQCTDMTVHAAAIRLHLSGGPLSARQLSERIGVSQPTISRALSELGDEILRLGAARSSQYALRDGLRGLPDIPIYRIDSEGRIRQQGILTPARPDGFVMRHESGVTEYSDGLPWWLFDMRPDGYLGRAYAAHYGAELGLPERLTDWSDTGALQALLAHGDDVAGNLLLGHATRYRFLAASVPEPISEEQKSDQYPRLAAAAARGELAGFTVGGERPKFTTYAETLEGPRHLIVKFSEGTDDLVSERWRDLLLAEHLALETLREGGVSAATTRIFDIGGRRFLEVERFDRIGPLGRCALNSLAALDAEFVGLGSAGWPAIARRLAAGGQIREAAVDSAELLWAFGILIGNTDMHNGNMSFLSKDGCPYEIAPAYDMTPMATDHSCQRG